MKRPDLCSVVDQLVVPDDADHFLQLKNLGRVAHPRVVDAVGQARPGGGGGGVVNNRGCRRKIVVRGERGVLENRSREREVC